MNCSLSFFSQSDIGKVRKTNQDSLAYDTKGQFFVLADGMGGHNGGEVASAMAVHLCLEGLADVVSKELDTSQLKEKLLTLIDNVNLAIFEASTVNPTLQGMGSTVVLGVRVGSIFHYCHVGDSRLYLLRHGLLQPLTQDHSLQQEMIDKHPEDMKTIQRDIPNNIVTQALGVSEKIHPSYQQLLLKDNDLLLASSDGLHGAMEHIVLEELASRNTRLLLIAKNLIDRANDLDGNDNISVVLARVHLNSNPIKTAWNLLKEKIGRSY